MDEKEKAFTNPVLKPKKIPIDRININHHIIINGYLNEKDFMNSLICNIKNYKKYKDAVFITPSSESLKFEITFEEDEKYEKECIIDIELFKYDIENENKYLLEFIRRGGVIPQYYQNFLTIKEIIEKELNEKNEGNEESDENNENNNNLKENILKL